MMPERIKRKLNMLKYQKFEFCILFILISFLAASCNNRKAVEEKEIDAKTPVTVTVPVLKDIGENVELPAVTSYQVKNIIRSSTTGLIEFTGVTPGENINTGKLLFTVRTLEAAALKNGSAVDTSLGFKGIIRIVSPKEGVVSSISHQTGDFVQEGDEVATISDRNSLVFILTVPFEMSKYIEKNRVCSLKLPDNSLINGLIKGILPEMNVSDQTISYIVYPESNRQLPQNLMAVATINKNTRKNALVLPKKAILGNEIQTEFWVMKLINDSTAVKVPVNKGIENSDEVEITEPAFLPEDRILLTGNYGLPDTAAVIIKK